MQVWTSYVNANRWTYTNLGSLILYGATILETLYPTLNLVLAPILICLLCPHMITVKKVSNPDPDPAYTGQGRGVGGQGTRSHSECHIDGGASNNNNRLDFTLLPIGLGVNVNANTTYVHDGSFD